MREPTRARRLPGLAPLSCLPNGEGTGAALVLQCFQFCFCSLTLPGLPWQQRTAGEPGPFAPRKLALANISGLALLSQAVLKKVSRDSLEALAKPSRPTEPHLERGLDPASCVGGWGWEMPSQPHSSLFLARPLTSSCTGQEGGSHCAQGLSPEGSHSPPHLPSKLTFSRVRWRKGRVSLLEKILPAGILELFLGG